MKHLGFRLTGKPSQAQISTVRIYDRIDARRDLSIGEVHLGTAVVGPRWAFELVRSSPPRQIPSARAPNTSDVGATLSVCVESAIRAATAVLGTPPALSNSTALRKYHGGDTEDDRDNECSKHGFSSVGLGLSVRFDSTVITHLAGWQAVWWLVEVSTRCAWRAVGR
jgi:hypothetical protein